MKNHTDLIQSCFERVAETGSDITAAVYSIYAEASPEAIPHIEDMDGRTRGRMLDQVYNLLLGDIDEDYLAFETRMHEGYGANPKLYQSLLVSVKQAVQEAISDSWSPEDEDAWNIAIDGIMGQIDSLDRGNDESPET